MESNGLFSILANNGNSASRPALPVPDTSRGGYRIRFTSRKRSEGKSAGRGSSGTGRGRKSAGAGTPRGRGRGRGRGKAAALAEGTLDDDCDAILDEAMRNFESRMEEDNSYIQQMEMDDMDNANAVIGMDTENHKIGAGYKNYIKGLLGLKDEEPGTEAVARKCVFVPKLRVKISQIPDFDPSDFDFISEGLDVVRLREKLNSVYLLPQSSRCECGREIHDDDETDFEEEFEENVEVQSQEKRDFNFQPTSTPPREIKRTPSPPKKRFVFKKAASAAKIETPPSSPLPLSQKADSGSDSDSPDFLPLTPELKRAPVIRIPTLLCKQPDLSNRLESPGTQQSTLESNNALKLNLTTPDTRPESKNISKLNVITLNTRPESNSIYQPPDVPVTPKKTSYESSSDTDSPDFYPPTPEIKKKPTPRKKFTFRKKEADTSIPPLEELLNLAFTSETSLSSSISPITSQSFAREPSYGLGVASSFQPVSSTMAHQKFLCSDSGTPLSSATSHTTTNQLIRGNSSTLSSHNAAFASQKLIASDGCDDDEDFFVPSKPVISPSVTRHAQKQTQPNSCPSTSSTSRQPFLDSDSYDEDDDFLMPLKPVPSTRRKLPIKRKISSASSVESPEVALKKRIKKKKKDTTGGGAKSFLLEEVEVVGDKDSGSDTECSDLDKLDTSFVDTEEDSPTMSQQVRYVQSTNQTPDRFRHRKPLDQIAMEVIENNSIGEYDETDTFCVSNDFVEYEEDGVFTQRMNEAQLALQLESPNSRFKKNTRSKARLQASGFNAEGRTKPRRKRIFTISSSSGSE